MRHFLITVIGVVIGIFAFFFVSFVILFGFGLLGALSDSMKPKPPQILSLDMRVPLPDHGVIAHAQGFESPSLFPYMSVAGVDELWMQDTTGFAVSGIHAETEFYGGVMEKLDAQPQFEQFYEYKNAVNRYTETDFTESHREASTSYLTSLYDNAIDHIATDRKMNVEGMKQLLNTAPHSAETALDAGLVDKMGHIETVKTYVKNKAGGKTAMFVSVADYENKSQITGPAIAYIGGEGESVR